MMKKTKIILPALAVILVIGLMVGPALAYFTAHSEAAGSALVSLGFQTEIEEHVKDMQKTVIISNKGPESVWVRAMAFSAYDLDYAATKGWTKGTDGYYYFDRPLGKDDSTEKQPLIVGIKTTVKEGDTVTPPASGEFNVVVIYECTPVQYDASGNPDPSSGQEADWNIEAEVETEAATEAATTEGGGK